MFELLCYHFIFAFSEKYEQQTLYKFKYNKIKGSKFKHSQVVK